MELRPAERVLARLRGRRGARPAIEVPEVGIYWTYEQLREAINRQGRELAELRDEVRRPAYGLWAVALTAVAAALKGYVGGF